MKTRRLVSVLLLIGVRSIRYMGLAQGDACPAIVSDAPTQVGLPEKSAGLDESDFWSMVHL